MANEVGILTVVHNLDYFVQPNANQFDGMGLPHYFVHSTVPWHGEGFVEAKFAQGSNVINLLGQFRSDALQRNYGLASMRADGIRWAIIVDVDEFWEQEQIKILLKSLNNGHDVVRAPNMHVYWKSMSGRIYPDPQPDNPVVALRTNQLFTWSRLTDAQNGVTTDAEFHHFSYVRTNEEMQEKIAGSEHNHEWVPDWYEKVWLPWRLADANLHPVIPEQFKYVDINPVPDEILELFE